MLHRLMGRAILTIAHGVMSEHKQCGQFHQSREPDRRTKIIAEDEKRRAEWPHLGKRHSVRYGAHRVLSDAIMQILPAGTGGLELSSALECQLRFLGRPKISGTAKEPRDILRKHIQHFARCVATREALRISGKNGKIA